MITTWFFRSSSSSLKYFDHQHHQFIKIAIRHYLVLPVLRLSKVFGVEGEDWSQGEEVGLIKLPVNTKVILGGKYLVVSTWW